MLPVNVSETSTHLYHSIKLCILKDIAFTHQWMDEQISARKLTTWKSRWTPPALPLFLAKTVNSQELRKILPLGRNLFSFTSLKAKGNGYHKYNVSFSFFCKDWIPYRPPDHILQLSWQLIHQHRTQRIVLYIQYKHLSF